MNTPPSAEWAIKIFNDFPGCYKLWNTIKKYLQNSFIATVGSEIGDMEQDIWDNNTLKHFSCTVPLKYYSGSVYSYAVYRSSTTCSAKLKGGLTVR